MGGQKGMLRSSVQLTMLLAVDDFVEVVGGCKGGRQGSDQRGGRQGKRDHHRHHRAQLHSLRSWTPAIDSVGSSEANTSAAADRHRSTTMKRFMLYDHEYRIQTNSQNLQRQARP
jgi:hypothetical protein